MPARSHILTILRKHYAFILLLPVLFSCQKEIKLNYGNLTPRQVVIANLYPDDFLYVNISRSKQPDDLTSVEFLMDCKVDLYEDGIFRETLPFVIKDSLSGLGYYTSSFRLKAGKTYRIVSVHNELGTAEASEYLPPRPTVVLLSVLQHATASTPTAPGKYYLVFTDSAQYNNYYFIGAYYRVLKPVVDDLGDTTYVYDYLFNIPSYTPEIPNPADIGRSFFTDAGFDGQLKSYTFDFPSQFNSIYREILLIVELSNTGKNFYEWNIQQLPVGRDFLNEGQEERANISSNIVNGYGHFTGSSSTYAAVVIK